MQLCTAAWPLQRVDRHLLLLEHLVSRKNRFSSESTWGGNSVMSQYRSTSADSRDEGVDTAFRVFPHVGGCGPAMHFGIRRILELVEIDRAGDLIEEGSFSARVRTASGEDPVPISGTDLEPNQFRGAKATARSINLRSVWRFRGTTIATSRRPSVMVPVLSKAIALS